MTKKQEKELLDETKWIVKKEALKFLSISEATLYRCVKSGFIAKGRMFKDYGRTVYWYIDDLQSLKKKLANKSIPKPKKVYRSEPIGLKPTRICAGCEAITFDHRCEKCLKKWREKHNVPCSLDSYVEGCW